MWQRTSRGNGVVKTVKGQAVNIQGRSYKTSYNLSFFVNVSWTFHFSFHMGVFANNKNVITKNDVIIYNFCLLFVQPFD